MTERQHSRGADCGRVCRTGLIPRCFQLFKSVLIYATAAILGVAFFFLLTYLGNQAPYILTKYRINRLIENTQPVIRSNFDVYQDENRNRLIYVRDECSDDDIGPLFFLHIVPVDMNDLPDHRKQYSFDNLDFSFAEYSHECGGTCVAVRKLPEYDIASIRTGQYRRVADGFDQVWKGRFDVTGQTSG